MCKATGIKLGVSRGEVDAMNAEFESVWQEAVDVEVNRRLAARGLTMEVQAANIGQRQIRADEDVDTLLLTSDLNR